MAVIQVTLGECWFASSRVMPGQPALVADRPPAIDVQNRVEMIKEKCTPYLVFTEGVLLHKRPIAFDPSAHVPEQ